MRLGPRGQERPAVQSDDGVVFDLSALTDDVDGAFLVADNLARVTDGLARVADTLSTRRLPVLSPDGTYLSDGDVVEVAVEGLGHQRQRVASVHGAGRQTGRSRG